MTDTELDEMDRRAKNCPYRNPDCKRCNPPYPVVETKQRVITINWRDRQDAQINRVMKSLYDEGCRRFRAVALPKNGDYDRVRVMGWAS